MLYVHTLVHCSVVIAARLLFRLAACRYVRVSASLSFVVCNHCACQTESAIEWERSFCVCLWACANVLFSIGFVSFVRRFCFAFFFVCSLIVSCAVFLRSCVSNVFWEYLATPHKLSKLCRYEKKGTFYSIPLYRPACLWNIYSRCCFGILHVAAPTIVYNNFRIA